MRPFAKLLRWGLAAVGVLLAVAQPASAEPRWSKEKANDWYKKTGWLVGCNFAPSTAVNQIEMWQKDTWDPKTIDRELGWAQGLGFNSVRVFLHDLVWLDDPKGYADRIEEFLKIADKHKIGTMFVLFDSVWDPHPHLGKQRAPTPHLHNSGWVQGPGAEVLRDPKQFEKRKDYVQGVIRRFGKDRRVHVWDLWNEPDNTNGNSYRAWEPPGKAMLVLPLLKKTYEWARAVNPDQPLTSGVWIGEWGDPTKLKVWEKYQLDESDIITYHNYGGQVDNQKRIEWLRPYGRPILCTEYMARPMQSTFQGVLPYLKEQNVGAYNWGFVSGKSQTIYPWDSWNKVYTAEPPVWFHDIYRADGTAYRQEEVQFIRQVTGVRRTSRAPVARRRWVQSLETAPTITRVQ